MSEMCLHTNQPRRNHQPQNTAHEILSAYLIPRVGIEPTIVLYNISGSVWEDLHVPAPSSPYKLCHRGDDLCLSRHASMREGRGRVECRLAGRSTQKQNSTHVRSRWFGCSCSENALNGNIALARKVTGCHSDLGTSRGRRTTAICTSCTDFCSVWCIWYAGATRRWRCFWCWFARSTTLCGLAPSSPKTLRTSRTSYGASRIFLRTLPSF